MQKDQTEDDGNGGKIEFDLKLREIFINCEIKPYYLTDFQLGFHTLELEDKPITIYINSVGGCLYTSLAIYNLVRNSKCEIHIVVTSMASSGATFIVLAGDIRRAYKNSMFFIHEPVDDVCGEFHKVKESYKGSKKYFDHILNLYHEHTGKSKSSIKKDLLSNKWLTAKEALNYGTKGFIDEIIDE